MTADSASPLFCRVMHPTDFDARALNAFHHALELALVGKGELHLVHVDARGDQAGLEWHAFPPVRETLTAWGMLPSGARPEDVADKLGLRVVKTDLGGGDPVEALQQYAERHPADLLVVGMQPRHGLERLLRPSVSEALSRHAVIPTLFVPHGCAGFVGPDCGEVRLKNVLVPVDRSPKPAAAIGMALALNDRLGTRAGVHVLHVGAPGSEPYDPYMQDPAVGRLTRDGAVVETILATADDLSVDLIVMATAGHDSLLDVMRGSTTEQVLRQASVPVLATPAGWPDSL